MSEQLFISNQAQKHVQAYIDYKNIVGDDDGGKLMTDKEFEAYKKKVAESRKNHLYVYWVNIKGYDCKAIGPESMCFCGHRFKGHNFDNVKTKNVNCKTAKCKCKLFDYVPVYGSNDCKCLCKHSYNLHDPVSRKCGRPGCVCTKFSSKFTCNCTYPYDDHMTTIENRDERLAQGKSVDPGWMANNLTAGIGGLNSFTSMVNDVYELEYRSLMQDPNKKQCIIEDLRSKDNGEIRKKNAKNNEISALDLFLKSHKYALNSKEISINNKFNKISLK